MSSTLRAIDLAGDAAAAAARAARAAGVDVRETPELDELDGVVALIGGIWGRGAPSSVLSLELVRALAHAGGYVAAAFRDGEIVGGSVGFIGLEDVVFLHSHVTGVAPGTQSRSVGFALKQHQRAWALARGIDTITWTYDPLVRRNAGFNISRLGADASRYLVNFYGAMRDEVNRGDESDRMFVRWSLSSAAASTAAGGDARSPRLEDLLDAGAVVGLDDDGEGRPRPGAAVGKVSLFRVPPDVVALRRADPAAALAWRRALRDTLAPAMESGVVTGFVREGWYVVAAR